MADGIVSKTTYVRNLRKSSHDMYGTLKTPQSSKCVVERTYISSIVRGEALLPRARNAFLNGSSVAC